jgi:TonB family protein
MIMAGIGLALLYPAFRESPAPRPAATADAGRAAGQSTPLQAPQGVTEPPLTDAEAEPSTGPAEAEAETAPTRVADEETSLASSGQDQSAGSPAERLPEPQSAPEPAQASETPAEEPTQATVAAAPASAVPPTPTAPTTADVAPTETDARRAVADRAAQTPSRPASDSLAPPPTPQRSIPEPEPAASVAAAASTTEATRSQTATAVRAERDETTEARQPIASASEPPPRDAATPRPADAQKLINQALAQLASGSFDEARRSLQAAEELGGNPQLIANLRGEVDYRQQQVASPAQAFETLYPIDQLVALRQDLPELPRDAFSGDQIAVEVRFTVTERGEVTDIVVLDDPPPVMEQALRRAVSEWRFEPVRENGRPTPVRSGVRFTFRN